MPFGAPRHVASLKCHTPSRRMSIGAPHQVGHFFNAIRHHDGCQLVHPAKWDIGQFWGAFVTDADCCIPSGGSFGISIQVKMSGIDRFVYNSIYHSHSFGFFKYHNSIPYSLSYYIFKYILNLCTHFIYSFTYSFHILIHVLIS